MSKTIQIGGDFSGFKKAAIDASKSLSDLKRAGNIQLFDKETVNLLQSGLQRQFEKLKKEHGTLNLKAAEYQKILKDTQLTSEKRIRTEARLVKTFKEQVELQRQMAQVQRSQNMFGGRSTGSSLMEGFTSGARMMPGAGGMAGRLGMLGRLGLVGGAAAGILGAGAFGVSRGMAGFGRFSSGASDRALLMGRGFSNSSGISPHLAGMGMDAAAVRGAQLGGVDAFGKEGSSQNVILQRAQFARNFGMELNQVQSLGSGFRAGMGESGANKAMLQLQASLIASGIEGAVGPYLQTAAETLTQMNQTGIPMDSEILSVFSALVNSSRSAERVSQTVLGVHNAIKGSSGESNAALQAIFGSAGIGGRSVGGAQAAIRSGGLFGVDPGKAKNVLGLSDEDIAAFQKENIISKDGRGGFKDRAGGITKFLNQIKKDIGVTGAGRVAMKMGFGDDEVTAMGAVSQLEKALSSNNEGEIEKIRKKLDDASKGPQDRMLDAQKGILRNLDKINTSAAAQLLKTEAMNNNISETLGGAIAPAVIEMKKLMGNIDRGIIYIASFLGMEDNTQGNQKSAMKLPSKARVEEAFSREQSLRAELKDVESRLESESDPSVIAELKKRRASLGEGIATTQADLGDYREAAKKFEARGKQGDFSGGMMGNPRGLSQKESTQATELLEILKDYMKQSASAMKNIDKNTRKVKAGAKGDTTR